MDLTSNEIVKPNGYRAGAIVFLLAVGTIVSALIFEHVGGFIPCPLCLQQRYAYYFAVPAAFIALVLLSSEHRASAAMLFLLIALAFLVNTGLGVYQSGAEWKFWPGPDTCGGSQALVTDADNLLSALETTSVIRCDEASFRLAGLSFAGWNALISLLLFALSSAAAKASWHRA